jgi:hypothetical protein
VAGTIFGLWLPRAFGALYKVSVLFLNSALVSENLCSSSKDMMTLLKKHDYVPDSAILDNLYLMGGPSDKLSSASGEAQCLRRRRRNLVRKKTALS